MHPIHEIMLPTEDFEKSKTFYQALGYEVFNEQDWGMVEMKHPEGGPNIAMYSKNFFQNKGIGLLCDDLDQAVKDFESQGVAIKEDDRGSEPARIVVDGPDGLEITIFKEV